MAQRDVIEERRRKILEYITENEKANIAELSRLLNTTEATIRRDLILLEQSHTVIRTHGGAIRNEEKKSIWQTSSLYNRLEKNKEQKERIARFAATLVQDNESIIIDGGSTTQIFASYLTGKNNMLFVTNSPGIAEILTNGESNHIILVGGELIKDTHQVAGPDAEENIRKYYVDKCITGVTGVEPKTGCYAAIPSEASLKRTMIEHARECILLVDSSKFNRKAFYLAFKSEDVDIVITDSGIRDEDKAMMEEKGITVYVV